MQNPEQLSESKQVYRQGNFVYRKEQPWSKSVRRFLSHLEGFGLPVEHIVQVRDGMELADFVEGEMIHPNRWPDDALYEIGMLAAQLHKAARCYLPAQDDLFQPWCLREIGGKDRILCHGDLAPWNVLMEHGHLKVLVDWEYTGPLDPMVELARICWLFPQLVDDDLAQRYCLPPPEIRAAQVQIICDGYGLPLSQRGRLADRILEVMICETAHEAIDSAVSFDSVGPLWGFAWRTRSMYWYWRHKQTFVDALSSKP